MEDREIRPILEKYLVLASLHVQEQRGKHPELESPGGEELMGHYGGEAKGVPFLVFLDERGQLLANSNRPVKGKPSLAKISAIPHCRRKLTGTWLC